MTDPVSVLLIIGAAAVGPIGAQIHHTEKNPAFERHDYCRAFEAGEQLPKKDEFGAPLYLDDQIAKNCSNVRVMESVDQLCARVFREVGGYEWMGRWWIEQFPVRGELTRRTDDFRCIPTPAGYRR